MNEYDDTRPHLKLVGGTDFEKEKLGIPPRHRGVLFTRVLQNRHPQENTRRVEAGIAEEWSKWNQEKPFLEQLLMTDKNDPRRSCVPRNQREWDVAHLVAATIIQWLPTSVGCNFLRSAFKRGGGDLRYRLYDWERFSS